MSYPPYIIADGDFDRNNPIVRLFGDRLLRLTCQIDRLARHIRGNSGRRTIERCGDNTHEHWQLQSNDELDPAIREPSTRQSLVNNAHRRRAGCLRSFVRPSAGREASAVMAASAQSNSGWSSRGMNHLSVLLAFRVEFGCQRRFVRTSEATPAMNDPMLPLPGLSPAHGKPVVRIVSPPIGKSSFKRIARTCFVRPTIRVERAIGAA